MRRLLTCLLILIVLITGLISIVPITRTFTYQEVIHVHRAVVFEELLIDTGWNGWYRSGADTSRVFLMPIKSDETLLYRLGNENIKLINGKILLSEESGGLTQLQWQETVHVFKGFWSKIKLWAPSSEHNNRLAQSIDRFKRNIEQPFQESDGVRFKMYKMKGHVIAALKTTIMLNEASDKIIELYKTIKSQLGPDALRFNNRVQSRFDYINDSMIELQVGLEIKEATYPIPSSLKRLEVPSILILVASAKEDYKEVERLKQKTDQWVRKYNLKTATVSWIESFIAIHNGLMALDDSIRIVQPIYYWPQVIEEIY